MYSGIYHSLTEVINEKRTTLRRIHQLVASVPLQRVQQKQEDSWSIRDILEHLVIVEEGILRLAGALFRRAAKQNGVGRFQVDLSKKVSEYTHRKIRTRDRYEPSGSGSPEQLLGRLSAFEQSFEEFILRMSDIDGSTVSFPHWELGPLTLNEWLAFLVLHEERHARQIESNIV